MDFSQSQLERLWRSGEPLKFAWLGLGYPSLVEQFRGTDKPRAAEAFEAMLKKDLARELLEGGLLALGIQLEPALGTGPELLPAFVFGSRDVEIDWYADTVRGSGRKYEQIRVTRAPADQKPEPIFETSGQPRRGTPGPESGYDFVVGVYELLLANGTITPNETGTSAHKKVFLHITQNHRDRFPTDRGLDYKTFTAHLRKWRKDKSF